MKFDDKYPNQTPDHPDTAEGMIVVETEKPCNGCGKLTSWVEINYMAYFCSDECIAEFEKPLGDRKSDEHNPETL